MKSLSIRTMDDIVIASFDQTKVLDEPSILRIGEELQALILKAATGRQLLVDFSGVEFMSSLMIGEIVRLQKRCQQNVVKLKLCSMAPSVLQTFKVTGLTKMVEIYPDNVKAIEAFAQPTPGWSE